MCTFPGYHLCRVLCPDRLILESYWFVRRLDRPGPETVRFTRSGDNCFFCILTRDRVILESSVSLCILDLILDPPSSQWLYSGYCIVSASRSSRENAPKETFEVFSTISISSALLVTTFQSDYTLGPLGSRVTTEVSLLHPEVSTFSEHHHAASAFFVSTIIGQVYCIPFEKRQKPVRPARSKSL